MSAIRSLAFATLLSLAATLPAFGADTGQTSNNPLQSGDREIESCLAETRQQAPNLTAHDRRIILSTQCICTKAPQLCRQGMIQDGRLRQRVLDDK